MTLTDLQCLTPQHASKAECVQKNLSTRLNEVFNNECSTTKLEQRWDYERRRNCIEACSTFEVNSRNVTQCDQVAEEACRLAIFYDEHIPNIFPRSEYPNLTELGRKCSCFLEKYDKPWLRPFFEGYDETNNLGFLSDPICVLPACAVSTSGAYKSQAMKAKTCNDVTLCVQRIQAGDIGGDVNIKNIVLKCGDQDPSTLTSGSPRPNTNLITSRAPDTVDEGSERNTSNSSSGSNGTQQSSNAITWDGLQKYIPLIAIACGMMIIMIALLVKNL